MVMQLVDEGRVDRDEPVRRYLPDSRLSDPDAAAAITPRHLLTHTGGFEGDLFEDTGRTDVWEAIVRGRLLAPLSLTHTTLYAEEAIAFRTSAGHFEDPQTQQMKLSPQWTLPRYDFTGGDGVGHSGNHRGQ